MRKVVPSTELDDDAGGTRRNATPVQERRITDTRLADHRCGALERQQLEVGVRADREPRATGMGPFEERAVRETVSLVDLERDTVLDAERDEPLLPLERICRVGIAERRER